MALSRVTFVCGICPYQNMTTYIYVYMQPQTHSHTHRGKVILQGSEGMMTVDEPMVTFVCGI